MKICYISPVTSITQTIAEASSAQFLATLTNVIYIGGFGLCGIAAFLRIFRTYLKCRRLGNYQEMRPAIRDCAISITGLVLLPYFDRFIDVVLGFIFA